MKKISDSAGYLWVLIDRNDANDTISLKQSDLAQWVVEAFHFDDDTSSVETLADSYLPLDEDDKPTQVFYNYTSVFGMLGYLQGHSRADIIFAISQGYLYTLCPKRSHEPALECIGRYLKGTLKEGIILKPKRLTNKFKIDIFVDAAVPRW